MCGRFGFAFLEDRDGNSKWYRLIDDEPILRKDHLIKTARYDIRPTEMVSLIKMDTDGKIEIEDARWGFHPAWSKAPIINTRSENITSSNYWKSKIQNRCLIPATFFYEWKEVEGKKFPYLIRLKDERSFVFAGLYGREKNPKTGIEETCFSIITQDANSLMREIHNSGGNRFRQPVIVEDENLQGWLDPAGPETDVLHDMIGSYDSSEIEALRLLKTGNDRTHERPVEDPFDQ